MALLTKIRNKLRYELDKRRWAKNRRAANNSVAWCNVATIEETIDRLINSECSLCRYGDGEYKVMAGGQNGFQKKDDILAKRLREVLSSDVADLLVAIPNIREDMKLRTTDAYNFWQWFIQEWGRDFAGMLRRGKKYYNAHVTRLYIDYKDSGRTAEWFARLKQLWQDKHLLIVEGEKTHLGVGNDLFSGAKSIKRVECPSKDAFLHYEEILSEVRRLWQGELVLVALGQTATVLAYDLHSAGIRAIDIGHIDIEYEWFCAGVAEKTAIAGKYVKEVNCQLTGEDDPDCVAQIVARVGV